MSPTGPVKDDTHRPRSTSENENFVRDYFAQSRLHFIGSFRARYERMMAAVASRLGVEPATLMRSSRRSKGKEARERVVAHIDIDCFFASVAVVKNPELAGKPIAVCHGSNRASGVREHGGGEISSASYEARKFGVTAGMLFGEACRLCPGLISVPYDFGLYEEVSIRIYTLFFKHTGIVVEAVSVDEAYLDLTDVLPRARNGPVGNDMCSATELISQLRAQIFAVTGCTASAGIGPNKLVARLATKKAKPNGQLRVHTEDADAFVSTMDIGDVPGIGWRTRKRLEELRIGTIQQLRSTSLSSLQKEFGENQGKIFYDAVRGIDHRVVEPLKPRRSIGADCGWGVRFGRDEDAKVHKFVCDMAEEVESRVKDAGATGRRVTYKVMRKHKDAGNPYKFLGHGLCDVYTRYAELSRLEDLKSICYSLHSEINCPNDELRGLGIKVTDLSFDSLGVTDNVSKPGTIESYFTRRGQKGFHDTRKAHGHVRNLSDSTNLQKEREALVEGGGEVDLESESHNTACRPCDQKGKLKTACDTDDELVTTKLRSGEGRQDLKRDDSGVHQALFENDRTQGYRDATDEQETSNADRGMLCSRPSKGVENGHIDGKENVGTECGNSLVSTAKHSKAAENRSWLPNSWDKAVFEALPSSLQEELRSDICIGKMSSTNRSRTREGKVIKGRRKHAQKTLIQMLGISPKAKKDNSMIKVKKPGRGLSLQGSDRS